MTDASGPATMRFGVVGLGWMGDNLAHHDLEKGTVAGVLAAGALVAVVVAWRRS